MVRPSHAWMGAKRKSKSSSDATVVLRGTGAVWHGPVAAEG